MNKVHLIGNLTNEPTVRYTQQNTAVASYSIAVNTGYGEKKETLFMNIVTFGKTAEYISQYITKGQTVAISGRLKDNSYEDKDGNKHNLIVVVAEELEPVGNRKPKEESTYQGQVNVSVVEEPIASSYTTKQPMTQSVELDELDLPF